MALLRGKLLAGALFAGALIAGVEPVAPVQAAPISGRGVNGLSRAVQTDESMRRAMLHSRIKQDDEDLMVLISVFVRTLQ